MASKFLIDIDLNGNEIQNFGIQTTGTLPSSPFNGQVVNHSGVIKVYETATTSWKFVGMAADGTTITETSGVISVGAIPQSSVTGLATSLAGKVDDSQVLTNVPSGAVFTDTQLSQEEVEDYVGSLIGDGGATTVNYDDNAGTLTISSTDTLPSAGDGINVSTNSVAVDNTVVRTSGVQTIAGNKTFSNDVAINGDLTVSGSVTSKLSEEVLIEDNMVILNSNEAGTPTENAGIEVERGTTANASLFWGESTDRWYFSDGSNTHVIPVPSEYSTANDIDYINSASFSGGTLTLGGVGNAGASVSLDGRYLQSFTESDPIFTASAAGSITSTQVSNWDTAYGYGDHAAAGYLTAVPNAGIGAGTHGDTADGTKIDTITVDAQGRVTAIATGPVVDNNTQRTDEEIEDVVGAMFSGNVESGISVVYQDGTADIDLQTTHHTHSHSETSYGGGTLAIGGHNLDLSQGAVVQVYDIANALHQQVATDVVLDTANQEIDVVLPAGDWKIVAHGTRA